MRKFTDKLFRTLKYRNYRIFFFSQITSQIGTWMQQVAIIWLIYRITNSALMLGLIGFISQIPVMFLAPLSGVLADRFDKKKILIATQSAFLILSLVFSIMLFMNVLHLTSFLFLGLIYGIISAFDMTARQAYFLDLIGEKKDLSNAIALNSMSFHGSRFIGPAVAGFVIKFWGEGYCFLINAISFLPVIIAMFFITTEFVPHEPQQKSSILKHIKEGFSYILKDREVSAIILLVGMLSFSGMSYMVLLPAVVKTVFSSDSALMGIFVSCAGVGAFTGAIYLASRDKIYNLAGTMLLASSSLSIALMLFAISNIAVVSCLLLVILGFSMMLQLGGSNVVLQNIIPHNLRGRVISVYSMAFAGTVPLGNLLNGYIAGHFGVKTTFLLCGIFCLWAGFIFRGKVIGINSKILKSYEI